MTAMIRILDLEKELEDQKLENRNLKGEMESPGKSTSRSSDTSDTSSNRPTDHLEERFNDLSNGQGHDLALELEGSWRDDLDWEVTKSQCDDECTMQVVKSAVPLCPMPECAAAHIEELRTMLTERAAGCNCSINSFDVVK